MISKTPKKLLSTKQASAFLGNVPPGTLSNWRVRNMGPVFYKIGHGVRYAEEDLMQWVESNRVDPEELKDL
jgi:hypothetical protein